MLYQRISCFRQYSSVSLCSNVRNAKAKNTATLGKKIITVHLYLSAQTKTNKCYDQNER